MNELSLFTGDGGGLLASALLGIRCIGAVEYRSHSRQVLTQRQADEVLPRFPIFSDIRTFNGRPYRGRAGIVSGGFPCQKYSTAASGRNNADDLWPEMRRVVADVAPWYVFAENVSEVAIEYAAEDCRSMGYRTCAISLGASDLGGDHLRERHWLLAYADDKSQLRRAINAEMAFSEGFRHSVWQAEPREPRVVNGLARRMERLKSTGNGQVPIVAATALVLLALV
ncbi:DNA cytosine methyltransferase [Pseudomonas sp. GD04087]|uniref:DNA cytosine methyltransferase n=1 Tax=unclassified Pseudomonas TaxID=196821 RepID=UPI00244D36B0|nr:MULTISPECIES: DNA cytosine methyltransferase [unclassified Pseudomonas]MDH0287721.1 DNA cytosine methyltransferase [Pseudomonas sp. GD04087]MDH1050854.1 DNA cytosine methyltransferase [Pseudomonas sp. GD03903]MDH1999827.1 DNA cytosine methyltransferase [Pseudomonas sp. GD03691]